MSVFIGHRELRWHSLPGIKRGAFGMPTFLAI